MPYILKAKRDEIDPDGRLKKIALPIGCAGDLNFTFTRLCHEYINNKGKCYQTFNDIGGAMLFAIFELYRRHIASYEDEAILRNGDV